MSNNQTSKKKTFRKSKIRERDFENIAILLGEINMHLTQIDDDLVKLVHEIYDTANIAPTFLELNVNKYFDDDFDNDCGDDYDIQKEKDISAERLLNVTSSSHERRIMNLFDKIQERIGYIACQANTVEKTIKEKITAKPNFSTSNRKESK